MDEELHNPLEELQDPLTEALDMAKRLLAGGLRDRAIYARAVYPNGSLELEYTFNGRHIATARTQARATFLIPRGGENLSPKTLAAIHTHAMLTFTLA